MRYLISIMTLTAALLFVGCAAKPAAQPSKPTTLQPVSKKATFVESSSSNEVIIKASGLGANVQAAMQDSELAALWFVLFGGNNPMLQTPQERNAFNVHAQEFYKNRAQYFAGASSIKGKRAIAGQTEIDRIFTINTQFLREALHAKDIITSVEELNEDLGTITVTVLPKDDTLWDDTQYQAAVDVISEYLQDRNFEVIVLRQAKKTNKLVQKAAILSGVADPMYALAMESGSDIYISVNLDKTSRMVANQEVKKASVTLSAFYTATAKQVGASSGYSPERAVSGYTSITQEATNDAIEKVLGQIQKSWKKEVAKGKYFKVVVTTSEAIGSKADRPVYETMRAACQNVKRNGASTNVYDYTLQCKDIQDSMQLMFKLEDHYAGAGKMFREMDSGALLVIKVANSQDDELIIE